MKQNFWILLIILACSAVACKSGQKKDVKDTAKTEPKKEVADTTAITVAASGAFAQFAE
jgi:hypothetical protein